MDSREKYFTEGPRDPFGFKNLPSVARVVFKPKRVKGTRGTIFFLESIYPHEPPCKIVIGNFIPFEAK